MKTNDKLVQFDLYNLYLQSTQFGDGFYGNSGAFVPREVALYFLKVILSNSTI